MEPTNRTHLIRTDLLLAVLLGLTLPSCALAETSTMRIEQLRGDITVVRVVERPHTVMAVLSSPEGALLVDFENPDLERLSATPEMTSRVRAALETLEAFPPRYLVLTHWHPDHVGGNEALGPRTTIVAHRNVRRRLAARQTPHWLPQGVGPMPEAGLPDVVFDHELTLHMGAFEIHLWHFGPAHTDGDTVVYFPHARVAHVGDLFHGFEHPSPGDDMAGLARTYEELLARLPDDALLITGHGPVVGREELVRAHGMLVDTLAWVQKRLAAGDERQAIQASAPPAPWDDRWQGSRRAMEMWIGAIFRSFELARGAEAELLRIHQQVLDAHRRSDADTLIALHAEEVLSADLRGGIVRSTRAEQAEKFRSYLGSTTFSVYEDRTPPVARVSQDGSLGWVIADVRAEGTQKGAAGSSNRLAMRSVWIELYARRDGSWRLVGIVSDVEPLGPDTSSRNR